MTSLCKVRIDLSQQKDSPVAGELLWAEDLDGDLYRLRSVPSVAFGFAEGDIVRCRNVDGVLTVDALVGNHGNGVIRVYFREALPRSEEVFRRLKQIGCTYEQGTERLFLFSVPGAAEENLEEISIMLNGADEVEAWEIAKMPSATVSAA